MPIETIIRLGVGKIIIGDTYSKDGVWAGISFADNDIALKVGKRLNPNEKDFDNKPPFLRIVADNPESLSVLIEGLKKARKELKAKKKGKESTIKREILKK